MNKPVNESGTVHVIDDDPALRKALVWLMESVGHQTVAYASAQTFLENWNADQSGCIVTDMRMPEMSGIELLKRLRSDGNDIPVILISAHGTVSTSVRAMKLGALDFLEKPFDEQALLDLVNGALAEDRRRRTNELHRRVLAKRIALLSEREHEVLNSILAGLSNRQIAQAMDISPKTVETYRSRILEKTGVARMDELREKINFFQLVSKDRRST
jgi:FixJ family two-component response regulator